MVSIQWRDFPDSPGEKKKRVLGKKRKRFGKKDSMEEQTKVTVAFWSRHMGGWGGRTSGQGESKTTKSRRKLPLQRKGQICINLQSCLLETVNFFCKGKVASLFL